MERRNLPDKEFKVRVIRLIHELGRRIEELSDNFNREKNVIKNQSELKNTITKMKKYNREDQQ